MVLNVKHPGLNTLSNISMSSDKTRIYFQWNTHTHTHTHTHMKHTHTDAKGFVFATSFSSHSHINFSFRPPRLQAYLSGRELTHRAVQAVICQTMWISLQAAASSEESQSRAWEIQSKWKTGQTEARPFKHTHTHTVRHTHCQTQTDTHTHTQSRAVLYIWTLNV